MKAVNSIISDLPAAPLRGTLILPGDKSISHRALLLGAIARGETRLTHLSDGADVHATIRCLRALGVSITNENDDNCIVHGKGRNGFSAPDSDLDCGNSATTMRLLAGLLAGQPFSSTLTGDASLLRRPMGRIVVPLRQMGANIVCASESDRAKKDDAVNDTDRDLQFAPLTISPAALTGLSYTPPVASAQVKSCLLLAGLYADGPVQITEPIPTRDHTERLLTAFGAPEELTAIDLTIPGDLSSAAYFLVAATLLPGSALRLPRVGINPTRDGILQALQQMGADITVENVCFGKEPYADLLVQSAALHAIRTTPEEAPALIDEFPILAVAAACAEGESVFSGLSELRVKESDRLTLLTNGLLALDAKVTLSGDTLRITGNPPSFAQKKNGTLQVQRPLPFHGCSVDTAGDHRLAMAFTIASLFADGDVTLSDSACVSVSYPDFYSDLRTLLQGASVTMP